MTQFEAIEPRCSTGDRPCDLRWPKTGNPPQLRAHTASARKTYQSPAATTKAGRRRGAVLGSRRAFSDRSALCPTSCAAIAKLRALFIAVYLSCRQRRARNGDHTPPHPLASVDIVRIFVRPCVPAEHDEFARWHSLRASVEALLRHGVVSVDERQPERFGD